MNSIDRLKDKQTYSQSYIVFNLIFRIVRNKAAEKAKISGYGSASSPLPAETALRGHPTYSINGILGIPQTDGNANLQKRKREDLDGKYILFK